MTHSLDERIRAVLARGTVIPAHPLALTADRQLDERRQRALTRYYVAAGAGGLAVAVHTTQFAIREHGVGLFAPVLTLASEEMDRADRGRDEPLVRIGGVCGGTAQAVREAELLADLGFHAALLNLAAVGGRHNAAILTHCRAIAEVLPVVGFYLQPAVGGPVLAYRFWREFVEIENVVAIKVAPFNRYRTIDVVRAVAESGRNIALYTGNDDTIVTDLLTPFAFQTPGRVRTLHIVGGILGHWAFWTRSAVTMLQQCHASVRVGDAIPHHLLRLANETTDVNAAVFDAANNFAGCITGVNEVLRRQGLLEGTWCLDPHEQFGPGQVEEIARVYAAYPWLNDDEFVRAGLETWLTP